MADDKEKILRSTQKAIAQIQARSGRFKPEKWDFANWILEHITIKENGRQRAYSFKGYEPFIEIANTLHECDENWFLKGTQIGFSTFIIGWNFYLPYWRGFDCAYALPDKVNVEPFMETRFGKEQLDQNDFLEAVYNTHYSKNYFDAGSNYIYFLGANLLSEQLTKPIDQISLDEVTIIEKDAIERIHQRMDKSIFAQLNGFAHEIYPGGPTDAGFESGRQNIWLIKCRGCNHYNCLEEIFYNSSLAKEEIPKCIRKQGETYEVICEKCGKKLNRAKGQWVARYGQREINSYRLPQVIFKGMPLQQMMRRWLKSRAKISTRTKLHSSMLAIPDAGDLQRINRDILAKLKRDYDMRGIADWSISGMDLGNKCHAVWGTFDEREQDVLKTVWWEEYDSDDVVDLYCRRLKMMKTQYAVIDAMPLTNTARKIAYQAKEFGCEVFLNYYRGDLLKEDEKEHLGKEYRTLAQDREQALDAYCDLFVPDDARIVFPARVQEERGLVDFEDSDFAAMHLRGSQKDEVEDNRLGKKVYKYKKHIENHYFHAGNYLASAAALLAQEEAKFVGAMPVFGSFMRT